MVASPNTKFIVDDQTSPTDLNALPMQQIHINLPQSLAHRLSRHTSGLITDIDPPAKDIRGPVRFVYFDTSPAPRRSNALNDIGARSRRNSTLSRRDSTPDDDGYMMIDTSPLPSTPPLSPFDLSTLEESNMIDSNTHMSLLSELGSGLIPVVSPLSEPRELAAPQTTTSPMLGIVNSPPRPNTSMPTLLKTMLADRINFNAHIFNAPPRPTTPEMTPLKAMLAKRKRKAGIEQCAAAVFTAIKDDLQDRREPLPPTPPTPTYSPNDSFLTDVNSPPQLVLDESALYGTGGDRDARNSPPQFTSLWSILKQDEKASSDV